MFKSNDPDMRRLQDRTLADLPALLDICSQQDSTLPIPLPPAPHPPISLFSGWVLKYATDILVAEVARLVHVNSGYHANAANFTLEQVERFSTIDLYDAFSQAAPALTCAVGKLLDALGHSSARAQIDPPNDEEDEALDGDQVGHEAHAEDGDDAAEEALGYHGNLELNIWLDEQEAIYMMANPAAPTTAAAIKERRKQNKDQRMAAMRNSALLRIRTVVIISIFMQTSTKNCNTLQTFLGLFLTSINCPERAVDALNHMGIVIASSTISRMNTSVSNKCIAKIRSLWALGVVRQWVYDNLEFTFSTPEPTQHNQGQFLSTTAATFLPFMHGITLDHVRCNQTLWERSPFNPEANQDLLFQPDFEHLVPTRDPGEEEEPLVLRRAWYIREILVTHSEYFGEFKAELGQPPMSSIVIPTAKTEYFPAQLMNIKESTPEGNADVIANLLKQAKAEDEHLIEHCVLVHGDLATIERLSTAMFSRGPELNETNRMQFVIPIPGLFHFQMAAADALHRIYIAPKDTHNEPTSLLHSVGILRSREVPKIRSSPVFRQMHDVIHHDTWARILDCWRIAIAQEYPECESLKDYAESDFVTWNDIVRLSLLLAKNFVANDESFHDDKKRPLRERDVVQENSKLWLRDALLYIDLCHSIRYGDVGAIEELIVPWTWIFSNCGKHKYATHLTRFILTIKHVYPPDLRLAVEMHWLCNLTGRPDGWKPIDFLQEVDNCFEKIIFGPSQSNASLPLLIKRSTLIAVLRAVHGIVENNFHITKRTSRHAKPDMRGSIQRLVAHMEAQASHDYRPGRGVDPVADGGTYEVKDRLNPHTIIEKLHSLFPKRWDLRKASAIVPDDEEGADGAPELDEDTVIANISVYD